MKSFSLNGEVAFIKLVGLVLVVIGGIVFAGVGFKPTSDIESRIFFGGAFAAGGIFFTVVALRNRKL